MTDGHPSVEYELTSVRGVPAARFPDGMLEVYTGRVTIVVFANTDELINQAVERLQSANALTGDVRPGQPLPSPVPGAMQGELSCS